MIVLCIIYSVSNSSRIGTEAKDQTPSMRLCLDGTSLEYNKYLVLHETGHALGLFHDHQHPDADDILDKEAAISDLLQGQFEGEEEAEAKAEKYYKDNFAKSTIPVYDEDGYGYDRDSIMRYE